MKSNLVVILLIAFVGLSESNLTSEHIAQWDRPRAALIRNNIYFDGGIIWNGTGDFSDAAPYKGASLFKLSLNDSFDIRGGSPAVFEDLEDDNPQTTWFDGFMFADYDEFYTYGGRTRQKATAQIISYPLYDPPGNMENALNKPNPIDPNPESFQLKITNGAGANAPSENRGFYFGGLRREDNGVITGTDSDVELSDYLLTVDTSEQGAAKWDPTGLPPNIRTRAEAGLAWIPAGEKGMLIAIGGALSPTDSNYYTPGNDSSVEAGNNFTEEISIYDISHNRWFTQNVQDTTTGHPPRMAQFCVVVASNFNDSQTHHDIYVIGGWDANETSTINSNVWVLSIPSFQWIELEINNPGTPRQGHSCFLASPTQIIVVGGTGPGGLSFKSQAAVDVFDIKKLEWTGFYDATENTTYTPPESVSRKDPGGSTPDDLDDDLVEFLKFPYDQNKLRNWYPYAEDTPPPPPSSEPSKRRKWVTPLAATLGTVGGLALIGVLFFFLWLRPRRRQRAQAAKRQSHTTDDTAHRSWIQKWLGGTTAASTPGKDLGSETLTETDGAMSPPPPAMSETTATNNHPSELEGYFPGGRPPLYGSPGPHEIDARDTSVHQVHEVHGRSSTSTGGNWRDLPGSGSDIRQHNMYPPSVVSAGYHPPSVAGGADDNVSQPTGGGGGPSPSSSSPIATAASASPRSRSPAVAPIASIPETAAFRLDGGGGGGEPTTSNSNNKGLPTRGGSNRAVSPIRDGERAPQRPGHRRHNSSMSSGLSPLPSPGREEGDGYHDGPINTV